VSGHAATPHLERANAAEVEVSRLKTLVQQQADRIAWLEGEVAGWRIKLAPVIAERDRLWAESRRLRDALRPFADPGVWYPNYDGAGLIFRPDFYAEREAQKRIEQARAALVRYAERCGWGHMSSKGRRAKETRGQYAGTIDAYLAHGVPEGFPVTAWDALLAEIQQLRDALGLVNDYLDWQYAVNGGFGTGDFHAQLVREDRPMPSLVQVREAVAGARAAGSAGGDA
jgi:hypothetical protein